MRIARDVDEQVPKNPIDQPWRSVMSARFRDLGEGNLEFVETVLTGLIDPRRLAGRSDKESRKEIRQRRMIEPVREHAAQKIGPAQERTVRRSCRADGEMIAPAGSGVAAI